MPFVLRIDEIAFSILAVDSILRAASNDALSLLSFAPPGRHCEGHVALLLLSKGLFKI